MRLCAQSLALGGVGEEEEVVEAEIDIHGVKTLRMSDWKRKGNGEATVGTRYETQRELQVIMKQMIAKGLAKAFEPERRSGEFKGVADAKVPETAKVCGGQCASRVPALYH